MSKDRQAFPKECRKQLSGTCDGHGMTLREYYAGLAMQGLLSYWGPKYRVREDSMWCTMIADSIIDELERR